MSTLEDLNSGPGGMAGWIGSLSQRLRPVSRRSMLVGAAVAGSALATKPKDYILRPVAAYATICGPGNTASSGWTVFCATVNKGVNSCPPGSFAAGWWKAADSSWCGRGYRYIVDCNASCSKCSTGCTDGICDSRCWSCSCGRGSTATCDQRRICCNAFRYGQCNTQVKCSGGVHCRVVSCVAPYRWANCTTTSLQDNRTSEHSAPALPVWGPISQKYRDMLEQASYLKASTGPLRAVGDGYGQYVTYQGGSIFWSKASGTVPVSSLILTVLTANGGVRGPLGYPLRVLETGLVRGGWRQNFQRGTITRATSTAPLFAVHGDAYTLWVARGREAGVMGYPTSARTAGPGGGWTQIFQAGVAADSPDTTPQVVLGAMLTAWRAAGAANGVLGYPAAPVTATPRGSKQAFRHGELWALGSATPRRVYGAVLGQWRQAGAATGSYGYPVTDTVDAGDGQLTCTFEGGTITA